MRITKLTLNDYVHLRVGRIKEISINFNNDTQLIIGSNGSGKSSLIHELLPFPPVRSSFGKDGYKLLRVEHNGEEYELIYDVREGHQFFKGKNNLNVNGNFDLQRMLIMEHFGISNAVHTILKCGLRICDVLPSQRKKFLMNVNPVDVDLFLEKYKKVHKETVALSNNLDHLYSRQKQLLTQKIPEEQYQAMLERKELLENQEKLLLMWMTRVSTELEQYVNEIVHDFDRDQVIKHIHQMFRQLPRFTTISRTHHERDFQRNLAQREALSKEILDLNASIEDMVTALNDYEQKKVIITRDGESVDEELSLLVTKEQQLSPLFTETFSPITATEISTVINDVIPKIEAQVVNISYVPYQNEIVDKSVLHSLYKELIDLQAIITKTNQEQLHIEKLLDEKRKALVTYQVSNQCDGDGCQLYQVYNKSIQSKEADIKELNQQLSVLQQTKAQHEEMIADKNSTYEQQCLVWRYLDAILLIIHGQHQLSYQFSDASVLEIIRQSPFLLIERLNEYVKQSEMYHEYVRIQTRIRELKSINQSLTSKKQLSMELLDREITSITNRLIQLRERQTQNQARSSALRKDHEVFHHFHTVKNEAHTLLSTIDYVEREQEIIAHQTYLKHLYKVLHNHLTQIRSELVDITKISKEQELLIVRLDKEVNSVIDELKPRHEHAKHVDSALVELPIIYTKSFVDNIIETTNIFLSDIMTYQLALVPTEKDNDFDFTFPVLVNNELVKDISECSDGQKAIIQFAFNLALIVELKFNDYPLYCDEIDRTLDTTHARRLVELLLSISNKRVISQLFIVGHFSSFLDAFAGNGNTIVLNGDNIILPDKFNVDTHITYF